MKKRLLILGTFALMSAGIFAQSGLTAAGNYIVMLQAAKKLNTFY